VTVILESTDAVDAGCIVRSVPLGGGALSRALQAGDARVADFLTTAPHDTESWSRRIRDTQGAFAGRDWLTPLLPAFAATGPATLRLSRAGTAGVVVTTGQQPGLFGGPQYTWSKALSALAFADALEAASGIPVAPVFWAATDDADWMEAAVTHVVGANGLDVLQLDGPPTESIALSDVRLGETGGLFERLRAASGSAAYLRVLELAADAYVPHATIGAAYLQLLRAVLEPLGIAVLDAAHPALRHSADPFLRRALGEAAAIASALALRSKQIAQQGFTPQVETIDSLSLVFRTAINRSGSGVRERVPVAASAQAVREAERGTLGANVLLRPVLEAELLPTVAYHAGPGELAYFAQVDPIAHTLGVRVPVPVPRWSGEIVEQFALRALHRLGLDEQSLVVPHEAEARIARAALDEDVSDSLERLRLAVETQVRALGESSTRAGDLVAAETVQGLQRDLARRIDRMERRMLAAVKTRESGLIRDLAVARAALRPQGSSPERVLNFMPMLARHGPALLDQMLDAARAHAESLVRGSLATP
jgi:bacillithiol biosynthesis cysteine-adding enzyme BshC